MKIKIPEKQILSQIKSYLNAKGFYHIRINTGLIANPKGRFYRSAAPGTPDICACIFGRFVGIECKSAKGKQSVWQKQHQDWIERSGGEYWLVKSLDELIQKINERERSHKLKRETPPDSVC